MNGGWGITYEIAPRWMTLDFTDGKSTLVQVMAWCPQATIHYLSQCRPRSMSPNGVTRPQWVDQHFWNIFQFTLGTFIFDTMLGVDEILFVMTESSQPVISYIRNETKNSHFSCDVYMRKKPSNYFKSRKIVSSQDELIKALFLECI